jgi:hypothetical protein
MSLLLRLLPDNLIAVYLGYRSLGRFLQTCKAAAGRLVAPQQIAECRRRAREAWKAPPPRRLERQFGGVLMFKVFDPEERGMEVGLFRRSTEMILVKLDGAFYVALDDHGGRHNQELLRFLRYETLRADFGDIDIFLQTEDDEGGARATNLTMRVDDHHGVCVDEHHGHDYLLLMFQAHTDGGDGGGVRSTVFLNAHPLLLNPKP